ncbi:Arabinose efflux permease [Pyrodictium delaneyi]|uniref:Arabinose efflux permease n=1 Tax=Pyrodictium delaneyi TaxID=1273541 RepID=A0A0P0N3M0_9CREN|nr:MFS transporter [Pyrodictium delaneyi]ALL00684.1 Arabinose efflux permease [Pyrodictium delaneyi]
MERRSSIHSTATAVLPLIVANAARGMVIPVYRAYSSALLALQGYSGAEIGAGLSLAKLIEALGFPLAGILSDRGLYIVLISMSVALMGLAGLLVWSVHGIVGVVAAYTLMNLSLALWVPSRNTALSALLPFTWRGRGIALVSIAFNVSRIAGPLIFAYYFAGRGIEWYRLGFLAIGTPALVAALLVYALLRNRLSSVTKRRTPLKTLISLPDRRLTSLYLYALLSRAGVGTWIALMGAVFVKGFGLPEDAPGLYISISAASWLLIGYFSGALTDRFGPRTSLLLAEAAFMASLFLVSLIPLLGKTWLLAVTPAAVMETLALSTYVSAVNKLLTTANHVGIETGRLNMLVSLASTLGIYVAGHAYEYSPFLVPGVAILFHVAAFLLLTVYKVAERA